MAEERSFGEALSWSLRAPSAMRRDQGIARSAMSVFHNCSRRQSFKCVPCASGTSLIRFPAACKRMPKSTSSIAVAMDPVMAQIGVERRKAPHARSVVIAAKGGCNLWSRLQRSHKSAESLLFDDHIRVNESEDISGGLSRRQIARPHGVAHPRGAYPLAIVGDDRYRISFCKFADPGVKSVVEDDDLIS